jgi:hypothetical protein
VKTSGRHGGGATSAGDWRKWTANTPALTFPPDGTRTGGATDLEHQKHRWPLFPLPEDLTGKRLSNIRA